MKKHLGMICIMVLGGALSAQAQVVPRTIPYQGRVLVQGTNYTGTGQFKFVLGDPGMTVTYWSNDGTSTAGSEPSSAVSIGVDKGLYALMLGDTNLMMAIPDSVFTNANVTLREWFNDGTTGSQLLSPDQPLGSAGYALMAAQLEGGNIDANDATNELIQAVTLSGTSLQITDAGGTLSTSLASLLNDADANPTNELNSALNLSGTTLQLTDPGGMLTTSLASLVNDADANPGNEIISTMTLDNGTLLLLEGYGSTVVSSNSADLTAFENSSLSLVGTELRITDGGGTLTAALSSLVNDADANPTNEINNSLTVVSNVLYLADAGGTLSVDLTGSGGTWVTDGTNVWRAAGSVGIGTNAPSEALDILGNALIGGSVTASNFVGDGSGLTNLPSGENPTNELNSALNLSGTTLQLTDPGGMLTTSLASLVNDADANAANELISTMVLVGSDLILTEAYGSPVTVATSNKVSLASLINDADANSANELNTALNLSGTTLQLTDPGGMLTTSLASLVDDADANPTNEVNTALNLSGTTLQLTDPGGMLTASLASLIDDADASTANEVITTAVLVGTDLIIYEAGNIWTVPLGSLSTPLAIAASADTGSVSSDSGINYMQLEIINAPPPGIDCDDASEYGRMIVDPENGLLYICTSGGWVAK